MGCRQSRSLGGTNLHGARPHPSDRLPPGLKHCKADEAPVRAATTVAPPDAALLAAVRSASKQRDTTDLEATLNDIARAVADRGADVNCTTGGGNYWTPLHLASFKAHAVPIVTWLLAHGADVAATDSFGSTPLHTACYGGCVATAKALLQHGADPRAQNHNGRTPLDFALGTEIRQYLISQCPGAASSTSSNSNGERSGGGRVDNDGTPAAVGADKNGPSDEEEEAEARAVLNEWRATPPHSTDVSD
jgi:ankyrin repeat protein